jgi:hypothetical protein
VSSLDVDSLRPLFASVLCVAGLLTTVFATENTATPRRAATSAEIVQTQGPRPPLPGQKLLATSQMSSGPGWSLISSPSQSSAMANLLTSVACASPSQCWAVVETSDPNQVAPSQTFFQRWNGASWQIVNSQRAGTGNNVLNGITCISASQCWAVGQYDASNGYTYTLIEQWDGTAWAIIASPNSSQTSFDYLRAVVCTSTSDCWAVGGRSDQPTGIYQTFTEHWDGVSWTIRRSPSTNVMQENYLEDVACTSTSDCWAIGYYLSSGNAYYQTLVEHWNGTTWVIITSPNTSATDTNKLNSIACPSASECWAVGSQGNGSGTLIERWDGTAWTIVNSPGTGDVVNNDLYGVTCNSDSDCWATGSHGYNQTLIEHWNGTSWSIVSSPNVDSDGLWAVTCNSALQCWAGGSYRNGKGDLVTLIEEYSPTVPALTGVVSEFNHGSADTFDINLPLTGIRGVECRSSGSLGAGNYKMIFNFANNLVSVDSASVTSGTGTVSSNSIRTNQYTVHLTGVSDQQYVSVTLNNVVDSENNTGNVLATMGVLIGDVNGSGVVDSGDVFLVRQKTGQTVSLSNFREDVNASGVIDSGDVFLTRQHTATSLPNTP